MTIASVSEWLDRRMPEPRNIPEHRLLLAAPEWEPPTPEERKEVLRKIEELQKVLRFKAASDAKLFRKKAV